MTIEIRTNVCEIFVNGWRSSQTILRKQRCMCLRIFLRTQIRNVLRKVISKSRNHSIFTHFPKDRNCEVCLRTKITWAPCRRRIGEAAHRAEKFGDMITADHKVFYEEGESRNNDRYAVVVRDFAIQKIQSFPCTTKTSQETEKSLPKFLEPSQKPKVVYSDNTLEFGTSCEEIIMESPNFHTLSILDIWYC